MISKLSHTLLFMINVFAAADDDDDDDGDCND